ncbi:hypothetical protein K491DRAFT_678267 [Lophiostoma macrostomum CBS 122681]|uniref:Uncharacterized protein n=1 Tax=Lophiostoma macrostomum CBS 122681 TaxID=1314788 RepID=A0A6A6T8D5_9PLEO|nr:hypothetical protein K491DRAFT_678267 [Lophiostoma macrostomum CBS 122681]
MNLGVVAGGLDNRTGSPSSSDFRFATSKREPKVMTVAVVSVTYARGCCRESGTSKVEHAYAGDALSASVVRSSQSDDMMHTSAPHKEAEKAKDVRYRARARQTKAFSRAAPTSVRVPQSRLSRTEKPTASSVQRDAPRGVPRPERLARALAWPNSLPYSHLTGSWR